MSAPSIQRTLVVLTVALMTSPMSAAAQAARDPAAPGIDAATRARVIENAIAQLDSNYVFPDVAAAMAADVRARLARGEYDAVTDGATFARLLTDHFRGISKDRHLRVEYSASARRNRPVIAAPDDNMREARRTDMRRRNCGFVKVELLPENVGYLKFNFFGDPEVCAPTATAAMGFVAHADALIIDLRDNGGGTPAMVAFISSYLLDQRTHLNDIWERRTNHTNEYWTHEVPGPRFGGQRPVLVLTSNRTFSGAEEFSYNLKNLERATIVGERTGGGAHPVRGHDIGDSFMIGVPFARAISPITKTNWEGTGVAPDVEVPAAEALEAARKLIAQVRQTP
jgi:hypothetical protein